MNISTFDTTNVPISFCFIGNIMHLKNDTSTWKHTKIHIFAINACINMRFFSQKTCNNFSRQLSLVLDHLVRISMCNIPLNKGDFLGETRKTQKYAIFWTSIFHFSKTIRHTNLKLSLQIDQSFIHILKVK